MLLWIVPLRIPSALASQCLALLDAHERESAARLATGALREAHVAAHVALRGVLGAALGQHPASLRFGRGPHGKPFLGPRPETGLHFNLSHTQDVALIALTRRSPVGVDIESLAPLPKQADDLLGALAPEEREVVLSAAPAHRALATYRCWVRKEALLKATGCGISLGLDNFSVEAGPAARLRASRHPWLREGAWTLRSLERPGRWTAAIALGAAMPRAIAVRQWQWRSPPQQQQQPQPMGDAVAGEHVEAPGGAWPASAGVCRLRQPPIASATR